MSGKMNDKHINITIENNIFSKNKGCDKKIQNNKGSNNMEPVRGFVDEPEHIKKARHALAAKALQTRQPDNPYLMDYNQQMASMMGQSAHHPYVYNNYNQYASPYGNNANNVAASSTDSSSNTVGNDIGDGNENQIHQIEVMSNEVEEEDSEVEDAIAAYENAQAAGAPEPRVLFNAVEDDQAAYIGPPEHFQRFRRARRDAKRRYQRGYNVRPDTILRYGLDVFHHLL
jgi:hypothetical protein